MLIRSKMYAMVMGQTMYVYKMVVLNKVSQSGTESKVHRGKRGRRAPNTVVSATSESGPQPFNALQKQARNGKAIGVEVCSLCDGPASRHDIPVQQRAIPQRPATVVKCR